MKAPIRILLAVIALVTALGLVWAAIQLWSIYTKTPGPLSDRCVATVKGNSVAVDPEQAHNASLIAGVAISRDLPPRATSIALATAYQESGIRNLDYGHADSLGLFQQRPSQGWGTAKQVMDPYYSAGKFFEALLKVKDWKTGDINDVAQKVQRSAYPEGYRRHVQNARTLASSLSGQTPASLSCAVAKPAKADAAGLAAVIRKAFKDRAEVTRTEDGLTVVGGSPADDWAIAHLAVGGVADFGVAEVRVGDRVWTHEPSGPANWRTDDEAPDAAITVSFAKP